MKTAHVSEEVLAKLRSGKRELRAERRTMTLPDKVRQVVQLQRVTLSAIKRRRKPGELEYVWPLRDR